MFRFKTNQIETKILGKPVQVEVEFLYESDDQPPDFDYGDEAENAKETRRFATGELLNLCLQVRVSYLGESASEFLGQCFVVARTCESDLLDLARDHELVATACADLEMAIQDKMQTLNQAFGS